MPYETIRVDREGPLLTITLNRPERLNAMPPQMADELGQAFYDLGDSRAVLITGEGKGFCSGADLSARGEGSALSGKGGSHEALNNHYNPAISQLIRANVPVICAVNGPRWPWRRTSPSQAAAPISFKPSSISASCPMAARPGC
jgi:2-(1,2-epoxy-1,2-dihydrophenyl)acetyl-CoA isomerase